MKRGVPPTALNARTGEFTPPGVTACARAKSAAEAATSDVEVLTGKSTSSFSPMDLSGRPAGPRSRDPHFPGEAGQPRISWTRLACGCGGDHVPPERGLAVCGYQGVTQATLGSCSCREREAPPPHRPPFGWASGNDKGE